MNEYRYIHIALQIILLLVMGGLGYLFIICEVGVAKVILGVCLACMIYFLKFPLRKMGFFKWLRKIFKINSNE